MKSSTQVHEISEQKLIAYTGNYTDYLEQREARYEQQLAAYKNQQKEIADLQAFADRFRPCRPRRRRRRASSSRSSGWN